MVCPVNHETRLDGENYWIETLLTSYPYGLKRKADPDLPAGSWFSPIPRTRQRSARYKKSVNFDKLKYMESILNCIENYITDDTKKAFHHIQLLLNSAIKKYL